MKYYSITFISKVEEHKFIIKALSKDQLKRLIKLVANYYYPNDDYEYCMTEIGGI